MIILQPKNNTNIILKDQSVSMMAMNEQKSFRLKKRTKIPVFAIVFFGKTLFPCIVSYKCE